MNSKVLKKIEVMLLDAASQRTWGDIQIDLKEGKPILIRQTVQVKIHEEYPGANQNRASH